MCVQSLQRAAAAVLVGMNKMKTSYVYRAPDQNGSNGQKSSTLYVLDFLETA